MSTLAQVVSAGMPHDRTEESFARLAAIDSTSASTAAARQESAKSLEGELELFRSQLEREAQSIRRFNLVTTSLTVLGGIAGVVLGVLGHPAFSVISSLRTYSTAAALTLSIAAMIAATLAILSYRQSRRKRFLVDVVEQRKQVLVETSSLASLIRE